MTHSNIHRLKDDTLLCELPARRVTVYRWVVNCRLCPTGFRRVAPNPNADTVVLLHGLGRSASAMSQLAERPKLWIQRMSVDYDSLKRSPDEIRMMQAKLTRAATNNEATPTRVAFISWATPGWFIGARFLRRTHRQSARSGDRFPATGTRLSTDIGVAGGLNCLALWPTAWELTRGASPRASTNLPIHSASSLGPVNVTMTIFFQGKMTAWSP